MLETTTTHLNPLKPIVIIIVTEKPFFTTTVFCRDIEPKKNRSTETKDHYITAKRPFEWNTLDGLIATKIPKGDIGNPGYGLKRLKNTT